MSNFPLTECRCNCTSRAVWLISGNEYDPFAKDGIGKRFEDEPACETSASYCEETAASLDLPFTKKRNPRYAANPARNPSA